MKPRTIALVTAVSLLAGCASVKRCMYSGAGRDEWQQPAKVVEKLALAPGARVADVGAGGGYFTFRLADAVGTEGVVYAVDVDESMVALLEKEAAEQGRGNVVGVLAPFDDPSIPETVDLIFVSNTYHHLERRVAYFAGARKYLKPGGRVAIVEFAPRDEGLFHLFLGSHATAGELIRGELEDAGYVLAEDVSFLERQSFQIFVAAP